jgi:hypothetical protein
MYITTLPERDVSATISICRGTNDYSFRLRTLSMNSARPNRRNKHASMPRVPEVGRPRCKPRRACVSFGVSLRIGGISAAQRTPRPTPFQGAMTKSGPPLWPGWENLAIRSWPNARSARTGNVGSEYPFALWHETMRSRHRMKMRWPTHIPAAQ